jgi:enterochelin esterase family protein
MKRPGQLIPVGLAIALLIVGTEVGSAQRGPAGPSPFDAFYSLGPDSLPREGVPKGVILGPLKLPSKAYPGSSIVIGFTFPRI